MSPIKRVTWGAGDQVPPSGWLLVGLGLVWFFVGVGPGAEAVSESLVVVVALVGPVVAVEEEEKVSSPAPRQIHSVSRPRSRWRSAAPELGW